MPRIYDSSLITQRQRDKTISKSFLNRIQNPNNPTTGSGPLLGITSQSIINSVKSGSETFYDKNDNGYTKVDKGCPCPCPINSASIIEIIRQGWATNIRGLGVDNSLSVKTDTLGNIYIIGSYSSPITINSFYLYPNSQGGPIQVSPYGILENNGINNVFIVKYNTDGIVQWATSIGGSESEEGYGLTTDTLGNVYVTGYYTSNPVTVNSFESGPNIEGGSIILTPYGTLANIGAYDAFIAKYDTDGNAQWATNIGGTLIEIGFGISTDLSYNVYVTGTYGNDYPITVNSFNSVSESNVIITDTFGILANSGSYDTFIAKYDTDGNAQWATNIGGFNSDKGFDIVSDSVGNTYITGYYKSNPVYINSFDSVLEDGTINVTPYGQLFNTILENEYCFLVSYDTNGVARWGTIIIGDDNNIEGKKVTLDSLNGVYITGYYSSSSATIYSFVSSPSFPQGPVNITSYGSLVNNGSSNTFIVKYNTDGIAQWATSIGGSGSDQGMGIATDSLNNLYVTGYYTSNPVIINNFVSVLEDGTINVVPYGKLNNIGSQDVFVVKFNTEGISQWATQIAGTNSEQGLSITTDSSSNVYVTGFYDSSPVTIYSFLNPPNLPGEFVNITIYGTLANSTFSDVFLVKYTKDGEIV